MHILCSANGSLKVENWYLSCVHEICTVLSSDCCVSSHVAERLMINNLLTGRTAFPEDSGNGRRRKYFGFRFNW